MKLATILLLLCVFVVEIRYFCLNFKRPEETAVFKWKQCHNMQKCRPFLQRCALISQDFAIFYREHIEFQNQRKSHEHFTSALVRIQCALVRKF